MPKTAIVDGQVFVTQNDSDSVERQRSAMEAMQRQASGLPPASVSAGSVPAAHADTLPLITVARAALGREIARLKAVAAGMERELARSPIGATGQVIPYLAEQHGRIRDELPKVKAEIDRLSNLTDAQARQWAKEHGYS